MKVKEKEFLVVKRYRYTSDYNIHIYYYNQGEQLKYTPKWR